MERYYTAEIHNDTLEIDIDGNIYQGSATDFISFVKSYNPSEILITINSYGGSVFDAFAIHDYLQSLSISTVAHINGIAASAATIIATGCNKITASENSFWLVHKAMDTQGGNTKELKRSLRELKRIDEKQIALFANKTGLDEGFISDLMDKDELISATEAFNLGFIDELTPALAIAASIEKNMGAETIYKEFKKSIINQIDMNTDEKKEVEGMFNALKSKFDALFTKEKPTDELTEAINKVAELKGVEPSEIVAQLEMQPDPSELQDWKDQLAALQAKIESFETVEEVVEEADVVAELTQKFEASEKRVEELVKSFEAFKAERVGTPLEEIETPKEANKINFAGKKGVDWTINDIKKNIINKNK